MLNDDINHHFQHFLLMYIHGHHNFEGQIQTTLFLSKFYNFVKGGNDGLSSLRRETMFINVLQGLHPLEAEILCLVKDKKLETKYKISKENVSQAFPDIIWGGRS